MESSADDHASQDGDQTTVDVSFRPPSREQSPPDTPGALPHSPSGEPGKRLSKASQSSQERLEGLSDTNSARMLPESAACSEEAGCGLNAEKLSSSAVCEPVSGKDGSRTGREEEEGDDEGVLSDGPDLEGETDVDIVEGGGGGGGEVVNRFHTVSADLEGGGGGGGEVVNRFHTVSADLEGGGGGGGEVVNRFHTVSADLEGGGGGGGEVVNRFHTVTADLSSMSPSISTDKTITSSTLSSSSMDGDSLRSVDPLDSSRSPVRALAKGQGSASSDRRRPAPTPSSSASRPDGDDAAARLKTPGGESKRRLEPGQGNASAGGVPQPLDTTLSPHHAGDSSEADAGDLNHHPASHHNENGDSTNRPSSSIEPFSCFVDAARLCDDLQVSRGSNHGNVQEQQLQTLVSGQDSGSRKQLKRVLRSGSWTVQSTVRKVAWLRVCSHLHKLEKAFVYVQMEKELFGDMEDEDVPIPTWPQQPSHEDHMITEHYLTPKGKNTAHKIVAVIGQLSPDITYCPGLLPLVDLFLHYMDAADCFSCVLTLLQSRGLVYLMQSRVAFEASRKVVKDLAKKYAKSAYVALVRSCSNVESVFDNWMGWIYSDLPFSYVVALTDSFLMEGIKVLYRVVLAILILYTKHTAQGQRPANVPQSISQFCRHLPVAPEKLLKVAFRIRGFSRRKLQKLQHHHEGLITSGAVNPRPDLPHISSHVSMENASKTVSMAHPNTRMMGFHDTGSNILSADQLATLWSWLPPRYAICPPTMLFNSADLGTSLMTLYTHIELEQCTFIVIKTVDQEVRE
ncbi:hypothetical protein ACOMHN_015417 [Nucella lapillus]